MLEEFIRDAAAAETVEILNQHLIDTTAKLGAVGIGVHPLKYLVLGETDTWVPIVTTYPVNIEAAFAKLLAADEQPFRHTMAAGSPVHRLRLGELKDASPAFHSFLRALDCSGLVDGLIGTVVVKPGAGAFYTISFPEKRPDLSKSDIRECHLIFHEFYYHYLKHAKPSESKLSPREKAVMSALVGGMSNIEISHELNITKATVDTYIRRSYEKLESNTRSEAVIKFLSLGYFEQDYRFKFLKDDSNR